jgi:hypothetical protein
LRFHSHVRPSLPTCHRECCQKARMCSRAVRAAQRMPEAGAATRVISTVVRVPRPSSTLSSMMCQPHTTRLRPCSLTAIVFCSYTHSVRPFLVVESQSLVAEHRVSVGRHLGKRAYPFSPGEGSNCGRASPSACFVPGFSSLPFSPLAARGPLSLGERLASQALRRDVCRSGYSYSYLLVRHGSRSPDCPGRLSPMITTMSWRIGL